MNISEVAQQNKWGDEEMNSMLKERMNTEWKESCTYHKGEVAHQGEVEDEEEDFGEVEQQDDLGFKQYEAEKDD